MAHKIIGELSCLIASFCLWYSITRPSTKKILLWQNVECIFNIIGILFLGGISGSVMYLMALVRNISLLAGKKRLQQCMTWGIVITDLVLGIAAFQFWYDVFPVLATVEYTILLQKKDPIFTKKNLLLNLILWEIYAICLGGIVMILTYSIMVVTSLIDLLRIYREKNKNQPS